VCDFLHGSGAHEFELVYQFAPGRLVAQHQNAVFNERHSLHWFSQVETRPRVVEGGPTPDGGWVAPSLGVREPAPRLVIAGRGGAPTSIVSVLTDADGVTVSWPTGAGPILVATSERTDSLAVEHLSGPPDGTTSPGALVAAWTRVADTWVADGAITRRDGDHGQRID
jgi:hypothetical protein